MRRALVVLALASGLGGCVYFNALYNAERLWVEAERDRKAGRAAGAAARYDSVATKAARSYRQDPSGPWADDALYLLGRAYLRQGDLVRARDAFVAARQRADEEEVGAGVTLHLGAVTALTGDRTRGIALLNEGLRRVQSDELRAEGHLWRARVLLSSGLVHEGWWDLDRAAEADPELRVLTDLERLSWGVAQEDSARAREGADRLLEASAGYQWADTVAALARAAAARWDPDAASRLLAGTERSPWPRSELNRLRLLRADLRAAAGDTAAARRQAVEVAGGFGPSAVEARLFLARLLLHRAAAVEELDGLRTVLLPATGEEGARTLLRAARAVELLVGRAGTEGDALALFAAAEVARDELGAPALARTLFLDFARQGRETPWAGKALLAAREVSREAGGLAEVEAEIRGLPGDPYVRAAREGRFPADRFRDLEERLRAELERLLVEVEAEVAERDASLGPGTGAPS